ncbi:2-dehydro-3-deoxy-D-gluconate 5-dehydrogenase KduD [candidate division KSB1 bacterium]|nr:2-dehydro-3-deoxy-D-gluconate 5-dehydrogenase KduD [candidate division KSB1 bacterium]
MSLHQFDLKEKVALVTGASRGIGQAIAGGFAAAGANLAIVARSSLEKTAALITLQNRRCLALNADFQHTSAADEIIEAVLLEYGRIDILVNNAGMIRRTPAVDYSLKDWDDVMNVNIRTLFRLCQAVGKIMLKQEAGKIINIASLLSFSGGINVPAYAASKGAVAQLTKALANEWASRNINVNAIAPGYIITENTAALRKSAKRNQEITERIPAGRWGMPEDLVGTAIFLASEASDYVHGSVLVVDGGWMAR